MSVMEQMMPEESLFSYVSMMVLKAEAIERTYSMINANSLAVSLETTRSIELKLALTIWATNLSLPWKNS